MFKSIVYKEWIKIRLIVYISLGLSLLALINIFLKVRHDILFVDAANYWYSFLFRGSTYFGILKFLPFAIGIGVVVAQYIPETVNKRIKLTFHLPVSENGILIRMHSFGAGVLLALFTVVLGLFTGGSAIFFPSNIISASLITMLPWFMGGMVTYFLLALILLEPVWLFRSLYTVVAAGFVALFYTNAAIGAFRPVLLPLTLIMLLLSSAVLFSGFRFRKGEM
jgi:hypothetical protein